MPVETTEGNRQADRRDCPGEIKLSEIQRLLVRKSAYRKPRTCRSARRASHQSRIMSQLRSYQHLRPALSGPELVPMWLALFSRRTATDADVEEALDAAEQWLGALAARRLIEGTVAMIAALPRSAASSNWRRGSTPGTLRGSQRFCATQPANLRNERVVSRKRACFALASQPPQAALMNRSYEEAVRSCLPLL